MGMDYQALLDMAVLAGEIMLVSGAEVYRVEDTVSRMLQQSGLEHIEVFVLATGIFVSISDSKVPALTVIRRVRAHSTNLNRIYQANNISRAFCEGKMTVQEANEALSRLQTTSLYGFWQKCAGYAMVTGFFAVLFSGGLLDCAAAAIVGVILAMALTGLSKLHWNDFCEMAAASFVLGLAALSMKTLVFPTMNLDAVIISAIMPLVPGVTFTSAIRDTLNGDYSSGVARIAEAIVTALAIAFGVGSAMMAVQLMGGVI